MKYAVDYKLKELTSMDGKDLRAWRKSNHLTLREVEEMTHVDVSILSLIERGLLHVTRETASKMKESLNILLIANDNINVLQYNINILQEKINTLNEQIIAMKKLNKKLVIDLDQLNKSLFMFNPKSKQCNTIIYRCKSIIADDLCYARKQYALLKKKEIDNLLREKENQDESN